MKWIYFFFTIFQGLFVSQILKNEGHYIKKWDARTKYLGIFQVYLLVLSKSNQYLQTGYNNNFDNVFIQDKTNMQKKRSNDRNINFSLLIFNEFTV